MITKICTDRLSLLFLGVLTYILSVKNLKKGDIIQNRPDVINKIGYTSQLYNIRAGKIIHNIGLYQNHCGQIMRAAGTSALIIKKSNQLSVIKLKSGELREFSNKGQATLGVVDGFEHFLRNYRKAGTMRLLGRRPRTRAYAKNPVDHPMGGRTKGGIQSKSEKGLLSKHTPTNRSMHSFIMFKRKRQNKVSTL